MDKKQEVRELIRDKINELRSRSYTELHALYLNQPTVLEVKGRSGIGYQLEIEAFWDDRRHNQHIRVTVSGSYGGLSDFVPETGDFIISPEGSCVGE